MPFDSTGKWLENGVKGIAAAYQNKGICRLCKVDPPMAMVGGGFKGGGKIVPLANPFLDFVGTWTARDGRAIFLECKSTKDQSLNLFRSGGLTEKQWAAMKSWRDAGAAVGVIWGYTPTGEVRFLSFEMIESRERHGQKSIKWDGAEKILQGMGFITADFMQNLSDWHPESKNDLTA